MPASSTRLRLPAAAVVGLLGLALGLALAACGGSGKPAAPAAPATTAAAAASATTAGAAGSGSGSGGAGAVAACATKDVKADLNYQPGGGSALLAVTNTSAKPCSLNGWASVRLTDPAGEVAKVPTTRVPQPGPPEAFTLAPGRTAFAGVKWKVCDKAADGCLAGNGFQVAPPGGSGAADGNLLGFPPPEKVAIAMSALQVGTLQPSNQGVLLW